MSAVSAMSVLHHPHVQIPGSGNGRVSPASSVTPATTPRARGWSARPSPRRVDHSSPYEHVSSTPRSPHAPVATTQKALPAIHHTTGVGDVGGVPLPSAAPENVAGDERRTPTGNPYLASHLPPDAGIVVEHPVVLPEGVEQGDWEWIEADKTWRSLAFPKKHRGAQTPGRNDVTLLRQWYTRSLASAHDRVASDRASAVESALGVSMTKGGAAAAAADRIAARAAEEKRKMEMEADPDAAAAAAAAAEAAARVEGHRKVASVHVQASHELIRQVMVHCYDRGALLAEVWAGYTSVLAAILRAERSARDAARAEAAAVRARLDAALVRNSEWEAAFHAQGGQELVERIEQLKEETIRVQHEVSLGALEHAASVASRAAVELKHHAVRDMSTELDSAVAAMAHEQESKLKKNSKSCMVSFAENDWSQQPCMHHMCAANIVPFCHEHSRNCTMPGCNGWAELCRPHATGVPDTCQAANCQRVAVDGNAFCRRHGLGLCRQRNCGRKEVIAPGEGPARLVPDPTAPGGASVVQSGGAAGLCNEHRCMAEVMKAMETGEIRTRCRGITSGGVQWCPAHGCRHPGCENQSEGDGFLCARHGRGEMIAKGESEDEANSGSEYEYEADVDAGGIVTMRRVKESGEMNLKPTLQPMPTLQPTVGGLQSSANLRASFMKPKSPQVRSGSGSRFGLVDTPADVAMLKEKVVELEDKVRAKQLEVNDSRKQSRAVIALVRALKSEVAQMKEEKNNTPDEKVEEDEEKEDDLDDVANDDDEAHKAATKLQAAERGRAARSRVRGMRDAAGEEEAADEGREEDAANDDDEAHKAATKLQAAERGRAARARVRGMRDAAGEEEAADEGREEDV